MKFERNSEAIIKDIKSRGMAFSSDLGNPTDYVNSMLGLLRGNENVTSYIACPANYILSLLLVTDSGKILFSSVTKQITKGKIFDKIEYRSDPMYFPLATLHEDETLLETKKEKGVFGATKDYLTLYFDGGSLELTLPKGEGAKAYKSIVSAKKKLDSKKSSAPKAKSGVKKDAPQSGTAEAIKEIRKMYDDGIITKEELMELLRAKMS